ncbi:MAG TPA: prolipoprotein diacylglyceryl transferase [Opitutales bacterium]|nr:prolipoprotein diacylglyceryl transferase [Opitutales bacterium]
MAKSNYWVHDLSPFLIEFSEGVGIRYYGLAYLAAFATAFGLLSYYHRRKRSPLDNDQLSTSFFAIIIGVLAGGRIGYFLFYDFAAFRADPLVLFRVWEGGMASHGGFIGVALAILWIARTQRMPVLQLADLLVTVAPPGIFFGRIANFINGELWGKITTVSWAVRFPQSVPPGTPVEEIPARHPSQLYEAGLEGLVLFIYLQYRFWKTPVVKRSPGQLTGEFFIGYAIARIVSEVFREPDAGLILGMSRGTFYSIFLIAIGIGFIVYAYGKRVADRGVR